MSPLERLDLTSAQQRLLASSGCVLFSMTRGGEFITLSDSIQLLTGYEASALIGQTYVALILPAYLDRVRNFYRRQDQEHILETQFELPLQHRDGRIIWVKQTVCLIDDKRSEPYFEGLAIEISTYKQTEIALEQSQLEYFDLFDSSGAGLLIWDGKKVLATNKAFEELFGYPQSNTIDLKQLFIDKELFKQLKQPFPEPYIKTRLRKANGEPLAVKLSVGTIQYRNQAVWVLEFRDREAHLSTEANLELSLAALEASMNAVIIADARQEDLPIIYINPAFEKIMGFTRAQALGQNAVELQLRTSNDKPKNLEVLLAAMAAEESCSYIDLVHRANGEAFWCELQAIPIHKEGILTHWLGVFTDVDEAVRREQQLQQERSLLRAIINAVPNPIFVRDLEGHYIMVNKSFLETEQLALEDVIGKEASDIHPPELVTRIEQEDQSVIENGKPLLNIDFVSKDQKLYYKLAKIPVWDDNGKMIHIVGFSNDITEIELARQTLEQSEALYRILAAHLPDLSVLLFDKSHKFVLKEGELLAKLKEKKQKQIEVVLRQLLGKQDLLTSAMNRVLAGETLHFNHLTADDRQFSIKMLPIRNEQDQIIFGFILIRDLSAILNTQENFIALSQASPAMIWQASSSDTFDFFNQRWIDFHKANFDGFYENLDWYEAIHPDDQERVSTTLKNAFSHESDYSLIYRRQNQQSQYRWISENAQPLYKQGQFNGYIGVGLDVTDDIETRSQLEAIIRQLPDMVFVLNADLTTKRVYSNNQQQDTLDALEFSYLDYLQNAFGEAIQMNGPISREFKLRNAAGEMRFYHAWISFLPSEDFLVSIRHITDVVETRENAKRQAEQLQNLRAFDIKLTDKLDILHVLQLALSHVMKISESDEGYIISLDKSHQDNSYKSAAYTTVNIMAEVGGIDQVRKHLAQIEKKPKILTPTEIRQWPVSNPMSPYRMLIPLIHHERAIGLIVLDRQKNPYEESLLESLNLIMVRIISALENAQLYQETQEYLETVRYLEQLKTDMIRIASHDLKNPIAAILGYVELLKWDIEGGDTEVLKNYIENVESSARRMQTMTNSILSLERIEQMAQTEARELIHMSELIPMILDEYKPMADAKQQQLEISIEADIILYGDPFQLHEAMANLINNAIKYTDLGGQIKVELYQSAQQLHFRVTDTGFGVPQHQQARLFQPFFRVHTKETKKIEGTGLGLHLVENIIHRHHGQIFFESVYGEGSVFGFDFPLPQKGSSS